LTACLWLTGCASVSSLYIPPSDTALRAFQTPPTAVIRLPVTVTVPKLGIISKDLTKWIDQKMTEIAEAAQEPEGITFRETHPFSRINLLWTSIQEPIFIDKDIWLLIQPEWISTGLTQTDSQNPFKRNVVLEMTARPILVFGNKPLVEKKILPPLRPYRPGPTGFHAISNTAISFNEANRILRDPKSGLTNYLIPGSGSYQLRVKGVRLYGSGGQVIVETKLEYNPIINLDGKRSKMTVYFRGVPAYDSKKEEFRMRHLDFDVKTGDFIMRTASWIFKSDILNVLRKKARIPIGSKLDDIKDRMNVVLNCPVGDHSRLVTQVNSFRVLDAFVNRDGIQAQMSLDGTADLNLFSR